METATMPPGSAPPAEDDGLGPGVDDLPQDGEGQEPPAEEPQDAGDGQPPTPPANLGAEEEEEPEGDQPQLFLVGDRQLGIKVGGRKPDSSVLKLKGGKIDLKGQYDRGDRFAAVAILQITGDNDQDTIEKDSGVVKSTSKAQNATVCGISTLGDYLALKLADHPEVLRVVNAALEIEEGE